MFLCPYYLDQNVGLDIFFFFFLFLKFIKKKLKKKLYKGNHYWIAG